MRKYLYITAFILLSGTVSAEIEKRVLISTFSGHGLFSCFFAVLNNVRWCERNNVIPVVDWMRDRHSNYHQKEGYNGGDRPWEYYFEPLADASLRHKRPRQGTIVTNGYLAPDGTGIPVTNRHAKDYRKTFDKSYRRSIYETISKYIKIKQPIIQKVDLFHKENLAGKNTLGIHIRGTDKAAEVRPVSVKEVCAVANSWAAEFTDCQFLVATDEERILDEAKELLNGPVVTYDAHRSLDGKPIHKWIKSGPRAQLGEEVLIEVLLLSRCNAFVHTKSNVSSAVLFFNPQLDNRLVG